MNSYLGFFAGYLSLLFSINRFLRSVTGFIFSVSFWFKVFRTVTPAFLVLGHYMQSLTEVYILKNL